MLGHGGIKFPHKSAMNQILQIANIPHLASHHSVLHLRFCIMKKIVFLSTLLSFIMLGLFFNPAYPSDNIFYLSPGGDDNQEGTRQAPWKSLKKASETAKAGDTIILLPGNYEGKLQPVNSGIANEPIIFRSEPRLKATLTGPSSGRTIVLENLKFIHLEGLHLNPKDHGVGWLTMRGCSHMVVEDCRMENSTLGLAAHVENCEHVKIRNSVFRKQTGGINMLRVSSVTRMVFEGNAVSRAGHSPLQFFPPNTNRYLVIRGNVFHAAWGRNFEFFHDRDVVFENNIITHAFNGGWSASSDAKLGFTRGIFRYNRVFRNIGGAINLCPWRDEGFLQTIRIYNNVFDDNAHYGIAVNSDNDSTKDIVFINNIFSRNDRWGQQCQARLRGGSPEQVKMAHNAFFAMDSGLPVVHDYGEASTLVKLQDKKIVSEHGNRYKKNLQLNPGYVDPANFNHALLPGSPLRDAGQFLTKTRGAGRGTILPVEDAAFFYDGFGIKDEQGDIISIGRNEQHAIVIKINHENQTLHLDREVSWQEGDPVSQPWDGKAPDIGAYEHGNDGRVSVQVVVEPIEAVPGEKVTIRSVVRGATKTQKINWWLGDGNIAEGMEIIHQYSEASDYAIRTQVTGTDGKKYIGTGYVWVAEPKDPSKPLVHSTWCPSDDRSWWHWKSYRNPEPASYMDVVEGNVKHGPNSWNIPAGYKPQSTGINYRHVRAPKDGGGISAIIHPGGWNIDSYTEVFIRYRVGKGTPLAFSLKPFGQPALLVALSPKGKSNLTRVADYKLNDDGKWHEITVNVKKVRDIYPDLQVLEGLYFIGSPQTAVKEGQWYDLDEVIIRPETEN